MDNLHDDMRAWLSEALRRSGLTPYALAKKAGVSTSTITRGLDPRAKHTISSPTVAKIRSAIGDLSPAAPTIPLPSQSRLGGFREAENEAYMVDVTTSEFADDEIRSAVDYLCKGAPDRSAWRISSAALEVAGYIPGDVVVIDMNEAALDGDVVIAQHYQNGGATTLFRLYQKPYLVAAAADRIIRRPLLVDDTNVAIAGVVVASFRPRRGHMGVA